MEMFSRIISNPIYLFFFGSGGVLIVVLTLFSLKSSHHNNDININIDVNSNETKDKDIDAGKNTKHNLEFAPNPIIDKKGEYEKFDFNSDEYYITFLKTIEEKKKGRDIVDYK